MTVVQTYAEAKRSIRFKKCLRHPDKHLELGVDHETRAYIPLCIQCGREGFTGPALGRDDYAAEKEWDMTTREVEQYQGQPVLATLNKEDIRKLLAPQAQDRELEVFLRFCIAQRLNPFAKDVWLIPFKNRETGEVTHAIVIGLQAYLKKAARNPLYQTYQSGCIVKRGETYTDIIGTALLPSDELFGAWCKVWKRGAPVPFEHRVALTDWDKGRDLWRTHKSTMIEVTVIRQGIRRAFPEEFGPNEEPQEIEGVVVEVAEDSTALALAPRVLEPVPEPSQGGVPLPQHAPSKPLTVPHQAAAKPQATPAPSERRFQTPTEFWQVVDALWPRDRVTEALGGSLGQWLAAKRKEMGAFPTWDDAYDFLVGTLGIPE